MCDAAFAVRRRQSLPALLRGYAGGDGRGAGPMLAAAFVAVFAVVIGVSVREIKHARAGRNETPQPDARVGMAAYLASLVTSPDDAGARRRRERR